jgi:hypothetical protein
LNKVELRHVIANYLFNEDIAGAYLVIDSKTQEFLFIDEDIGTIKYSHKFDMKELTEHYTNILDCYNLSTAQDFDLYHGHFWNKAIEQFLEEHYD